MILRNVIKRAFIICYQEDTSLLEKALRAEGFDDIVRVCRDYTTQELTYAKQARCLLGHYDAWQLAQKHDGLSLIVEADFVPCIGFGEQRVPFSKDKVGSAWGWLYSCAQRVYEFDGAFLRGHSATMVAYVLDAEAANKVDGFLDHEFEQNPPQTYSPWDIYIRMYAQKNGVSMYLVPRSYGEHGGLVNPEHQQLIKNPNHQADILIGKLHFSPNYAKGSQLRYFKFRIFAYLRAWARLFCLRYIEKATLFNSSLSWGYRARLVKLGFIRLIPFVPHKVGSELSNRKA